MNLINLILVLGTIVFLSIYLFNKTSKLYQKYALLYHFKDVLGLFNYFMDESYRLTYESSIIHWINNGIKNIPQDEKETIERNYVKQTILLMGDNNSKMISDFYGGNDFMVNTMIVYLRQKISNDGLADIINKANNQTVQM